MLLCALLTRLSVQLKNLFLSFFLAYLILIQISFYALNDTTARFEALLLLSLLPIAGLLVLKLKRYVFLTFGSLGLTTPIFVIAFLISTAPQAPYLASGPEALSSNTNSDIIIITAEKMTAPLMLENNGEIREDFKNLHKLADTSTVFSNLHTQTTGTTAAIQTVLLGKDLEWDTPLGLRKSRINEIRFSGSIITLHDKYRDVYVFNDYTGERYCDPKKHKCVNVLGDAKIGDRARLLRAFYWEYCDTVLPKSILHRIKRQNLHFFEDLVESRVDLNRYPERQFERFIKELRQSEGPAIFVMHTFLTDGEFNKEIGYEISDLQASHLKKIQRIKLFDKYLGRIIQILKSKGRMKNSLILIVSDTGSDVDGILNLTAPNTFSYPYNENISNIFGMIHFIGQNEGKLEKKLVFQDELYHIVNSNLTGKDYHYHRRWEDYAIKARDFKGYKSYRLDKSNKQLYRRLD